MKVKPGFGFCAKTKEPIFIKTWNSTGVENGNSFCDLEVKFISKAKGQFVYWLLNGKVEKQLFVIHFGFLEKYSYGPQPTWGFFCLFFVCLFVFLRVCLIRQRPVGTRMRCC